MTRVKTARKRKIYLGASLGLVLLAAILGALVAARPASADCQVIRSGTWTGTCGGAYRDCEVMTCRPPI